MFESRISAGATEKLPCSKIFAFDHGPMTWRVMSRNVWNDIVSWQIRRHNNSTKYLLHASMTISSKKKNWNPWVNCRKICSQIVLKWLYLARIGRPDILWSVNKLARSITKWTKACDKRLCRLISYIHHTNEYKQCCHVGNTAKQCRLTLFQDSDFTGDLEDSKSTSGGTLCVLEVVHLFQEVGCVTKKLQFRTVQQNQKSFPWTQDWGWTVYPLLIYEHDSEPYGTGRPVGNKREGCSPPHTIHKRK